MQKLLPAIRSAAAYVLSEAVDGSFPYSPPAHPLNHPLRAPGALKTISTYCAKYSFMQTMWWIADRITAGSSDNQQRRWLPLLWETAAFCCVY